MLRKLLIGAAMALAMAAPPAVAQTSGSPASGARISDDVVKIGVLTDLAGLYADINGPGAVATAQMIIDDYGGTVLGKRIELVSGDAQNKPDVASSVGGRWFDAEKVDVIIGGAASSSSLALSRLAADKGKLYLAPDPASSDLTGKLCNANTIHWVYDTVMLSNGTGSAVVKNGGRTWFFLTVDYAFGHALERDMEAVVTANGGQVLSRVRHPLNTQDFSSFLLQAQASKAQIVGLANAGGDTINSIKQAAEFGLVTGGQKLAGLLVFISDVHSIGLQMAQGLQLTEAFYWDLNEGTRAFTKRFAEKMKGRVPTSVQAGYYSALKHYLDAVKAAGTDRSDAVVAKMKEMPTDDPLFGKGRVRMDGRKIHDVYLFEVKAPSESKGPWDYYKLVRTIPGDEAFRPMDKGDCPLVTAAK
jgi:branched-chain amino acid transport system substrate-binding protein